jgi:hypothetical protein
MNGQVKRPQNDHHFRSNQCLARHVDPEHAANQSGLTEPIAANRRFELFSTYEPGRSPFTECAHRSGQDWLATGNKKDHQNKSEDGRDKVVSRAMNCHEGKTYDSTNRSIVEVNQ